MAVIPTGLALEDFAAGDGAAFRRRHAIPPERPVIAYVGRVAFEKNIDFLLRVTARLKAVIPDILFVVSGEGPALASLQEQARNLGLAEHARFVGYLDRGGRLLDCYRAADVVRLCFAHRDPGARATRSDGARDAGRLHRDHGHARRAARGRGRGDRPRGRGPRLRWPSPTCSATSRDGASSRAAGRRYAEQWTARATTERLLDFYREVVNARRAARPAARVS